MFSGIVQGKGSVVEISETNALVSLHIDLAHMANDLVRGASVSVAGVCLTATAIDRGIVRFDVMGETLKKTNLGALQKGDAVNIERSLRVGDEIGGHAVSGHVTGAATITRLDRFPGNTILTFQVDPAWTEFILPKGFIALDGCSLTVVDVGEDWFTVHLIPETIRLTTFGTKKVGDQVNLEIDAQTQAIVTTVKRHFAQRAN